MKCCICGTEIKGHGNTPHPIGWDVYGEDDRCCDECNMSLVIPSRIAMMAKEAEHEENE